MGVTVFVQQAVYFVLLFVYRRVQVYVQVSFCYVYSLFCIYFTDCKFMLFPPSMIAAGCIGAAIRGLLGSSYDGSLTERLHKITGIEIVSWMSDM